MDLREYKDFLSSFVDPDFIFLKEKRFFRINTLKISSKEFFEISYLKTEKTFYRDAFSTREDIGRSFEYFLGYLHPQSLSSMLPSLILNPNEKDIVLDVASAPGSKTTHIAMLMNNKGAIFANEWKYKKASVLFSNIVRLGVLNTKVGIRDAKQLNINNKFTKALADVPCSSLAQKQAYKRFTVNLSKKLSEIQKKIIINAFDALKEEGILVYSTCTYSPYENEEVVKFLLENRDAKIIDLNYDFPHEKGIIDYGKEFSKTARIYPKHFNSEGFFIAKIKKG